MRRNLLLDGEFRVRLSSIEAVEVGDDLVALVAEQPERICPHLHVPIESGSDAVLRRMRRRWASGRFVERCHRIREALDEPALTTDVIVGFPGGAALCGKLVHVTARQAVKGRIHAESFSNCSRSDNSRASD